jgi:hypothetical protein
MATSVRPLPVTVTSKTPSIGLAAASALRGGDGIAVIGFGKQRGFGEELAPARGTQDHQTVIDGAANQAKPTALYLVDRRRPVALPEQ